MPIISSGNGNTLLLNAKGSTFPPPQEKRMGGIRKGKSLWKERGKTWRKRERERESIKKSCYINGLLTYIKKTQHAFRYASSTTSRNNTAKYQYGWQVYITRSSHQVKKKCLFVDWPKFVKTMVRGNHCIRREEEPKGCFGKDDTLHRIRTGYDMERSFILPMFSGA